jgi:hypothetical protein
MFNQYYSVYVDDKEVNDYYMTLSQAEYLASTYDVETLDVKIINIDELDRDI